MHWCSSSGTSRLCWVPEPNSNSTHHLTSISGLWSHPGANHHLMSSADTSWAALKTLILVLTWFNSRVYPESPEGHRDKKRSAWPTRSFDKVVDVPHVVCDGCWSDHHCSAHWQPVETAWREPGEHPHHPQPNPPTLYSRPVSRPDPPTQPLFFSLITLQ